MTNSFSIKNPMPAPAVSRAFAILRLLSQTKEPQGVSGLSRALGIGKSTVHGILQALLAVGAIEDAGGRQYRLGPFLEELARSRRGRRDLSDMCRPHLLDLVDQLGQTAMFGKPEHDRFRIVVAVEGRDPLTVKAVQGGSIPLLAGVVGKIALAWKAVPMPEVLPSFTEETVVDADALRKELKLVRAACLAVDRGEYLRGVYAAASPVLDGDRLQGIIFAAGFQDQLKEEGLAALGEGVARAARAVSEEFAQWKVDT
jgi:DNA-binding IclR family transcriptional regulator